MNKWRAVTYLAVPACGALGIYLFSGMSHHEHHEQPVRVPESFTAELFPTLCKTVADESIFLLSSYSLRYRRTLTCAGVSSSSPGAATARCSSTASARRTDRTRKAVDSLFACCIEIE